MALTLPPPRKCPGSLHIHYPHAITLDDLFAAPDHLPVPSFCDGKAVLPDPEPLTPALSVAGRKMTLKLGAIARSDGKELLHNIVLSWCTRHGAREEHASLDPTQRLPTISGMITTTSTPPSYFPLPANPL
ncbi:hypothetical protein PCASD_21259 [Puccinia coronata f. sp. avenae]|uniref:Uncharacterized protein n=1 Tax=Puccinia coronata f. sp. avenae TaxID=200324 RepID=A0A2N5U2G3_9BASI|nr:hypothetical protein PCASD_21259 [Puccinia coronata f. sp. avenae]